MLLFLPGFATAPGAYRELLAPVRAAGIEVLCPRMYGVNGLVGRYTPADEARDAAAMLAGRRDVVVAGHSRGGQVAWRVANLLGNGIAGVVAVDPVDGAGRRPTTSLVTSEPVTFDCPTLIIGAGIGGACAPAAANHDVFARALPRAEHLVIDDMGHADLLNGLALPAGRRLCGGGKDPTSVRQRVSHLLLDRCS